MDLGQTTELDLLLSHGDFEHLAIYRDSLTSLCDAFDRDEMSEYAMYAHARSIVEIAYRSMLKQALLPLGLEESEWTDRQAVSGGNYLYQNHRDSRVFKDLKGVLFVEAIRWMTPSGIIISGEVEGISSSAYVRNVPFTPETISVTVINTAPPDAEPTYRVLDPAQLAPFFKLYHGKEMGLDPDEWIPVPVNGEITGKLLQHKSNPTVFKHNLKPPAFYSHGDVCYLMAIRWVPTNAPAFYGSVEGLPSVQNFRNRSFCPRTFDIAVENRPTGVPGEMAYFIIDRDSLDPVWEVYTTTMLPD